MVPHRLPKHTSTLPSSTEVPFTKRTSPSVQLAVRSTGELTAVHVDDSYTLKFLPSKVGDFHSARKLKNTNCRLHQLLLPAICLTYKMKAY